MAQEQQNGSDSGLPVPSDRTRSLGPSRQIQSEPAWTGDEGVDWRYIGYVLWRRKWAVLAAGILGIAAGVFLARQTTALYKTEATLWVEAAGGESGPVQGAEVLEGQGWAGLFTSLEVLEGVAREHKLYLRPPGGDGMRREALFGSLSLQDTADLVSGAYELKKTTSNEFELWHDELGLVERSEAGTPVGESVGFRWRPPSDSLEPGQSLKFRLSSVAQAALSLRRKIDVLYDPRAGNVITTSLEWNDAEEGARIHNAVVDTFIATAYSLKSRKLREVSSILDEQTQFAADRLREAELALEEFRVETVTLPSDQPQVAQAPGIESTRDPMFTEFFEKKLSESRLESEIRILEQHLERARRGDLNPVALQATPAVQEAPSLESTVSELVELQAERRTLLQQYTERHPDVRALDREIAALTTEAIPGQLGNLLGQKRSELANLQEQVESYASQLREAPTRSIEEARLRRNVEIAEELYQDLRAREKESELAASTALPDLQVVDRAVPPGSPQGNQGPQLFLVASLAGFGLGIAGAILHDRLTESKVRFPDDISKSLGLPVLGVVPKLTKGGSRSSNTEVMETFRAIRGHLDRVEPRGGGLVMITSPGPQEGKSMISANLALAYAAVGRRTLLIDADTRRGNAEDLLNCRGEPGLTDCLEERSEFADAVHETPVNGLSLLPHGSQRQKFDRNLLDSSALIQLLREAERRYDAVVIDTPPLSAGIDALAVGETVDKVLLVLRAGVSDQGLVQQKLDSLSRFGVPVVGAVLNDVAEDTPFSYYRYYRYDAYQPAGEIIGEVEILPGAEKSA